ncbi:MAG: helix-turn-helix transcriptional regulator [Selenomonas sp.]|uniref:helix-turn-helix transcriptional regulator n=1 Tax=Selenomonas sp. KH1T6 TaxID=3158784 RepID=UPI0008A814BD|nr:helix-turn-helix transcriptional regulator [Selenomonas sp.]SEH20639.1 putative transcriptional regulator [Selenomonas ruminantium]
MAELITRIHELRREQKMSQSELAEAVGIRRETLSHLENGKYNPSLKLAMDIAKVFGKRVEDVFEFIEDEDDDDDE